MRYSEISRKTKRLLINLKTKELMQNKNMDFTGENIYIGIDVHKKSWSVTILTDEVEHKTYTQPPGAEQLAAYVQRHYPGGSYYSAYEAGFCGYGHHRKLLSLGINNKVVNPADVPSIGKDRAGKTDKVDSRKIARGLRNGDLRGIHVFNQAHQELRTLARQRSIIQKDLRRYKQRIKMLLLHYTINIPEAYDNEHWSLDFEKWLKSISFSTDEGKRSLEYLLSGYNFHKEQVRQLSNELRAKFRKHFKEDYYLLRSIPGIGPLSAITIITEIGEITRFRHINQLCSFAGLLPLMHNSGETERTGGMTYRCNRYLRTMLIECSWQSIRKDPAMLMYYKKHAVKGNGKKAIVKVARKLLSRIRYILKNKEPYQIGIVG